MLLTKEVLINVSGNVSYYENLGYKINKIKDLRGVMRVPKGEKITVKVEDLPEKSGIEIEYKCDCCQNIFKTRYYRYLKNKHDLCVKCSISKVASDKENIKKRSGKNHHRYNDKLTDEEREKRRDYPEYKSWRKNVYEIGEYTCQACEDSRGGNLVAHHLDGWHWCKDKRFNVGNGIALCETCHKEFHDLNGYNDNTREQFIDFLISKIQSRNLSEASKLFADI